MTADKAGNGIAAQAPVAAAAAAMALVKVDIAALAATGATP